MDRSQCRWADAMHNLERACELDPRNYPYLINLGSTYLTLHDYDQHIRIMRIVALLIPERRVDRIFRASVEVYRRADTRPWRESIENMNVTQITWVKRKIHLWRASATLLLCTIATGTPPSVLRQCLPRSIRFEWSFPQLGRDFWVGVIARLKGDETSARAAFMRARAQQEEEIRGLPEDAGLLVDLGLIDAGLGRKEEALNEGRRAMELVSTEPYVKNAVCHHLCLDRRT